MFYAYRRVAMWPYLLAPFMYSTHTHTHRTLYFNITVDVYVAVVLVSLILSFSGYFCFEIYQALDWAAVTHVLIQGTIRFIMYILQVYKYIFYNYICVVLVCVVPVDCVSHKSCYVVVCLCTCVVDIYKYILYMVRTICKQCYSLAWMVGLTRKEAQKNK